MKKQILTIAAAAVLLLAASNAHAVIIDDTYWGAGVSGYTNDGKGIYASNSGDVYGYKETDYNISKMGVESSGSSLQVKIYADSYFNNRVTNKSDMAPGDLFLSTLGWNPTGTQANHYNTDSFANTGTIWNYVVNLQGVEKYTTSGGTARLYATSNADKNIIYGIENGRTAQAAWYKPQKNDLGTTGTWSYIYENGQITGLYITMNLGPYWNGLTDLGMHWTMECGNDVIEGKYSPVPEPTTMLLLGTGLVGLTGFARRRARK